MIRSENSRLASKPVPLARAEAAVAASPAPAAPVSAAMKQLLSRLRADESAMCAITRDWRFDAVARKFVPLQRLLDEQFVEIGERLNRLARRSRELGCGTSIDQEIRTRPRSAVRDGALEAHMITELLSMHGRVVARLRAGLVTAAAEHFPDRETLNLLAGLAADHEKDAFMLRALLWEDKKTAA